jgi:hypothetical protein
VPTALDTRCRRPVGTRRRDHQTGAAGAGHVGACPHGVDDASSDCFDIRTIHPTAETQHMMRDERKLLLRLSPDTRDKGRQL